MPYADFSYYKNDYQGELSEKAFSRWIRQACLLLDNFTNGKARHHAHDERVVLAACALTDALFRDNSRSGLASESTDGYAVHYTYPKRCAYLDVISIYLAETDLLSRWT